MKQAVAIACCRFCSGRMEETERKRRKERREGEDRNKRWSVEEEKGDEGLSKTNIR